MSETPSFGAGAETIDGQPTAATPEVAPETTAADDRPWQVISRGSMLLFAGTEEDARKYVQDNFPRVHVQPGSVAEPEADATLVSPDGSKSQWLTTDWKDVDA